MGYVRERMDNCGYGGVLVFGRRVGGRLVCPDCLLELYTKLQDEFDLRLVEGDGPHVVHVPTWNRMQPAVDAIGTEIARLCAEMISSSNPEIEKEILTRFKVGFTTGCL